MAGHSGQSLSEWRYDDCGRTLLLRGDDCVVVKRVTCHRKTCKACWPGYVESVKANIRSAITRPLGQCPLSATSFVIYSKKRTFYPQAVDSLRDALRKRFDRAGQSWVRIPLTDDREGFVVWPAKPHERVIDLQSTLDDLLSQHDRSKRIGGKWSVKAGRRVVSGLRLAGWTMKGTELLADIASGDFNLLAMWTGIDEFEIRGTDQELSSYIAKVAA